MCISKYVISEIRLYGLGKNEFDSSVGIKKYFNVTLPSKERYVDEKLCFFNDTRNKIKKVSSINRLVVFVFENTIYAHAIMYDDGSRIQRGDNPTYPISYLFYKDSIQYFKIPIPCEEWKKIWNKQANQSAVILEKDLTINTRQLNLEKYKKLSAKHL